METRKRQIVASVTVRTPGSCPDSIELAQVAREIGADAIILGTLPYSVPTERENALNALAIDRTADLPIILSNYPGRRSVEMGRAFLDRVGRSKNAIATRKARVISTASSCWHAVTRISNCPAAWAIRR
ncbi:dihydrodipicolinate synthase family protein [Paracoccus litorisediminis]